MLVLKKSFRSPPPLPSSLPPFSTCYFLLRYYSQVIFLVTLWSKVFGEAFFPPTSTRCSLLGWKKAEVLNVCANTEILRCFASLLDDFLIPRGLSDPHYLSHCGRVRKKKQSVLVRKPRSWKEDITAPLAARSCIACVSLLLRLNLALRRLR